MTDWSDPSRRHAAPFFDEDWRLALASGLIEEISERSAFVETFGAFATVDEVEDAWVPGAPVWVDVGDGVQAHPRTIGFQVQVNLDGMCAWGTTAARDEVVVGAADALRGRVWDLVVDLVSFAGVAADYWAAEREIMDARGPGPMPTATLPSGVHVVVAPKDLALLASPLVGRQWLEGEGEALRWCFEGTLGVVAALEPSGCRRLFAEAP